MTAKKKSTPTPADDWDINDFLSSYRPPEQIVSITVRGDLLGDLSRLEDELSRLREAQSDGNASLSDSDVIATAEKITALRHEVRASSREFRITSIGDRAWADLMVKHPPSDSDKEEGMPWNVETFYADALSQSLADPRLTVAEADKLLEVLSATQVRKLVGAMLNVNGGPDDELPKSDAPFVLRQLSEDKQTTSSPEGSLGLSSLGDR